MQRDDIPTGQMHLLKTDRFYPLFWVQFLGAFNDNFIKTAMAMFIAYGLWDTHGWDPASIIAISTGFFILPFVFVTPLAGNLSDKYDKAYIIRLVKLAEIFIIIFGIAVLYSKSIYLGLILIFLLGLQSAFFSPTKFSILPQHLKTNELIAGNAFISAGTYISILLGSIFGAIIAPHTHGTEIISATALLSAIIGYIFAKKVPKNTPPETDLILSYNLFSRMVGVIKNSLNQSLPIRISILAVSYFYFIAATFHSQFPIFTKQTLGADNFVLAVFMITFSVGIAIGGFFNHRLLKAKTDIKYTPYACLAIGIFGIDLYFAATSYKHVQHDTLTTLIDFLSNLQGIRLLLDTFMQSFACGFFVVPLRALVQEQTQERYRARVISGSNMLESLFILASSALSTTLLVNGYTIPQLYLTVSITTVIVAFLLWKAKKAF